MRETLVIMEGTLRRGALRRLLLACGSSFDQPPHEHVAAGDAGSAASVPPLELARRLADDLAEPGAERAQAVEAHREADFGDGEVGAPEQVLRSLDPPFGDVGRRGQ